MTRCLLLCSLILLCLFCTAQDVGVVMSGGGAKGIAHIGVLKALEENEIPIDYVVGTSMGGIIAGCYAAGMSPEQIEHIALSDDFQRWVNGLQEAGYNYYFHQPKPNPEFIKVNLSLDSVLNLQLNSSLASDVALNFAMAEKMALGAAIAGNNFDSLFVPLRVVAADIFTQNEVVLSKGSLADALRATQTVPFFYNPIRVDGKYLFDGGVYNNFPVDVAMEAFQPDVVIGCNVSSKIFNEYPFGDDERLISRSLLYMLLDKSDPKLIPETGVYIQPDLSDFSSFDFQKVRALIDSGYAQTIRQMPEIKEKVARRVTCDDVAGRRNAFNNKSPAFRFQSLTFSGFNSKQRNYIRKVFGIKRKSSLTPFYYSEAKRGFFRLVAENYFSNVYPSILYDTAAQAFNMQLTRRPQKNFQIDFGGAIATRDVSNIFLGLNFYHFDNQLFHFYTGFQTGNFYKSATMKTRIDYPKGFYLQPQVQYDNWDFLEGDDLLRDVGTGTVLRRTNRSFSVEGGVPVGSIFKGALTGLLLNNVDRFANGDVFISTDTLDELKMSGYVGELSFSANSLNRKQYASTGKAMKFSLQYFNLKEDYLPGSTSTETIRHMDQHQWFRLRASAEQYFNFGAYRLGYVFEGVLSNQPFLRNYYATLISAPAFHPLQDSPSLLLQNFRAFNFVAGGLRNVFALRNKLDLRLEAYLFKPIEYLRQNESQEAEEIGDFKTFRLAGTAQLVLHSPIGPISLSTNYYDDKENQIGVFLHVGFLLFNEHPLE